MPKPDDDSVGIRARTPAASQAWKRTLEDMQAIAEERRSEGWEMTTLPAIQTSVLSKADGSEDRFGLIHVLADNHADTFRAAYEKGSFPRSEAYRNTVDGFVYLVTELLDPDSETGILIASQYDLHLARGMIASAIDEGELQTRVKLIDGTELAMATHEDVGAFVPDLGHIKAQIGVEDEQDEQDEHEG
ncbi:hypothetical protein ACFQS4_13735 [Saliphagus sp. GCM10025317]